MHKTIASLLFLFSFFLIAPSASAQVCDDLVANGCETSVSGGWTKIYACGNGSINIQYCHPRLYIGSGHNLTIVGARAGKVVFDELLKKTTLTSGLTVRKAVGKNASGQFFTGVFTYDDNDDINSCYIKAGADRSEAIRIPD